jgi:hypothetical protein
VLAVSQLADHESDGPVPTGHHDLYGGGDELFEVLLGSNSNTKPSANAFRSLASISGVIDPALELMSKTRFASLAEAVLSFFSPLPVVSRGSARCV